MSFLKGTLVLGNTPSEKIVEVKQGPGGQEHPAEVYKHYSGSSDTLF